jgi:hypothetical protein
MSATLHPTATFGAPDVRAVDAAPAAAAADRELNRWLIGLGTPFVLGAVFFALSIATPAYWLIGVSLAVGPVLFLLMTVYLCLTSDANAEIAAGGMHEQPRLTGHAVMERAAA